MFGSDLLYEIISWDILAVDDHVVDQIEFQEGD